MLEFYEKCTGTVIDTIKYPLRDFDVDADVVIFENVDNALNILDSKENTKKI